MAHLKVLANRAYISNNLKKAMLQLEAHRYSFICAPTGYGKSIVCRTFFKNYPGYTILWIDGNSTKEIFWNNLCNAIKFLNPACSASFREIGFPETLEDANKIITILNAANNDRALAIVAIDNFDKIANEALLKIISSAYASTAVGVKYVFLTKKIHDREILSLISKGEIGFVGKNELAFSQEDIYDYFRLNEVLADKEHCKEIYDATDGWPYIVQLFLLDQKNDKTNDVSDKAGVFIDNNIWLNLCEEEREFLIKLSVFNKFTLKECIKQTNLSEKVCLNYLNSISLINYDEHTRTYKFNPVFNEFIVRILAENPVDYIQDITLSAADIYLGNGNYYSAIKLYYAAKQFKQIYNCNAAFNDLYSFINKENKDMFFEIANHYWDFPKNGNYNFSLIICFAMLIYNEKNMAQSLLSDIAVDIAEDNMLNDVSRNNYNAELEYVKAYVEFNDFGKMNESFKRISSFTKSPVSLIAGQYPFNFECPSMISMFHRKSGALDVEMLTLEDLSPGYYRITNGHGKGFEALMRADVLYNSGEIDGAEILCHKAIYMADSRNQYSVYIAANFLLALISIYNGANDAYKEYVNNINHIVDTVGTRSSYLKRMADVSKAFLYCNLSEKDNIVNWLKDEKSIEDNANFFSLSFINIILGKYLILNEDYHHFLGISGQFLGLSKIYSQIVPRIYTYIYLAIANNETGETEKARKFLVEAMELAVHDKIYMPFVHNYSYISEILEEVTVSKNLVTFVKGINKYSKGYEKGVKSIKKAGRMLASYGLTVREADVAKLAAQRLSNKEIAEQLFIAESTVKSNMKVIFNKLQINSRSELKNFFE